jgi:hypothetical protein
VERGDQLAPGEFWIHPTVAELASPAGIQPVEDVAALRDPTASDQEVDDLMAALEGT